jgi:hypothetical protein
MSRWQRAVRPPVMSFLFFRVVCVHRCNAILLWAKDCAVCIVVTRYCHGLVSCVSLCLSYRLESEQYITILSESIGVIERTKLQRAIGK